MSRVFTSCAWLQHKTLPLLHWLTWFLPPPGAAAESRKREEVKAPKPAPIVEKIEEEEVEEERYDDDDFEEDDGEEDYSREQFEHYVDDFEDDDDEDFTTMDDDELMGIARGAVTAREKERPAKPKTVGVLEKKGNLTVVGGEVVIGKEARGNVKVRPSSGAGTRHVLADGACPV